MKDLALSLINYPCALLNNDANLFFVERVVNAIDKIVIDLEFIVGEKKK